MRSPCGFSSPNSSICSASQVKQGKFSGLRLNRKRAYRASTLGHFTNGVNKTSAGMHRQKTRICCFRCQFRRGQLPRRRVESRDTVLGERKVKVVEVDESGWPADTVMGSTGTWNTNRGDVYSCGGVESFKIHEQVGRQAAPVLGGEPGPGRWRTTVAAARRDAGRATTPGRQRIWRLHAAIGDMYIAV